MHYLLKAGRINLFLSAGIFTLLIISFMLGAGCSPVEREKAGPEEDTVLPAEEGTGYLEVRAVYSAGGEEADDVRYTVESAEGEQVAGPGRKSSFELDAGRYFVTARSGRVERIAEAAVRAGEKTEMEIVLEAGILEIAALLSEDGPDAPDARFSVLSVEKDIRGDRESIEGPTRRSSFVLPAASYIIRVESGQASSEKDVEVKAGERTEAAVVMEAGILNAAAIEQNGTSVSERVRWTVFSAEEDTEERETVAGPTSRSEFLLSEGEYILQAAAGDRESRQRFEIRAGESLDMEITLSAPEDV